MSCLVSRVVGRDIEFRLPFRHQTKAELTRTLVEDGLSGVASSTASCVHFPRRVRGPAKQCGWCPGCIGRRQAILHAGAEEPAERYGVDLFGESQEVALLPSDQLNYLKATLMQVESLKHLQEDGTQPDLLRRHVTGTQFLAPGENIAPWVGLMRRYRDEWLKLIRDARRRSLAWAEWVSDTVCVAK
jgi:hypothetical protein